MSADQTNTSKVQLFYDKRRHETYGSKYNQLRATEHSYCGDLHEFLSKYRLIGKRCLEIGSSGGCFQDMVADYWGTDIAESLSAYYKKPYRVAYGVCYPFEDGMFDAIWTISVYEHIPHLQEALMEIRRLLKPGGLVFFAPAWQCRAWAAQGYAVRPYRELKLKEKLIKASIPIRDSILWRSLFIFPKRIFRHFLYLCGVKWNKIRYRRLNANYDVFWVADSDACNSIDPHDALLWFLSHGFKCLSHPTTFSALFVRNGTLILRRGP